MPQSLSNLLTHLIFSTKNREPFLGQSISDDLHPYLVGTLNHINCHSLQVGGATDHVHLFFRLSRTKSISEIVETLKTSSSKWIKTQGAEFANFHWQAGYGAFSVSQSKAESVITYIRNQPEHHRKISFQDEYRKFLQTYEIDYDERYVWD
jgi:putative transposase